MINLHTVEDLNGTSLEEKTRTSLNKRLFDNTLLKSIDDDRILSANKLANTLHRDAEYYDKSDIFIIFIFYVLLLTITSFDPKHIMKTLPTAKESPRGEEMMGTMK